MQWAATRKLTLVSGLRKLRAVALLDGFYGDAHIVFGTRERPRLQQSKRSRAVYKAPGGGRCRGPHRLDERSHLLGVSKAVCAVLVREAMQASVRADYESCLPSAQATVAPLYFCHASTGSLHKPISQRMAFTISRYRAPRRHLCGWKPLPAARPAYRLRGQTTRGYSTH
jgi:hypothetical protein